MKIKTRLILILSATSLLLMTTFIVSFSINTHSAAETQYKKIIYDVAKARAADLDQYFNTLIQKTNYIANDQSILNYVSVYNGQTPDSDSKSYPVYQKALNVISSFTDEDSDLSDIMVYTDSNELVISSGKYADLFQSSMDIYKSKQDGKVYVSYSRLSDSLENYALVVKKTIRNGYVLAFYKNDTLKSVFNRNVYQNSKIILFDPEYSILDTTYTGNLKDTTLLEYPIFQDSVLNNGAKDEPVLLEYQISHSNRFAYVFAVKDSGWYIASVGDVSAAGFLVGDTFFKASNLAVILAILTVLFTIVSILKATKPIYTIGAALARIYRGEYEFTLDVKGHYEFRKIANAFNAIIEDIIVNESRYKTLIDLSDNIIFEWDFRSNEVFFSNNFNKKFSYRAPSDQLQDSFLVKCKVHPEDASRYREDLARLMEGIPFKQNEYRWKNIYGDYIWILMRTAVIKDSLGKENKIIGVIVDIDRAKKSEKLLTARASYDSLTGLYNRETIEASINNEIELIDARKSPFAILFVDIDDFKIFNDKYSHATGDQVLKFTAQTIQEVIEHYGMAGRYGGDEFIICVRNSDVNDPARTAQDILNRLKSGFTCDIGDHLVINVSIGIYNVTDSSKRVDEIIGYADDAMYKIKKSGKSNYGFM
jgi:diguanylate cyclase (GGDEF)-like protein/PAS domain S-box-containing protein